MHIVPIWIMHINALKTQLMHKNVQTSPENPQNWHNTPVVLCWHKKFFESNKRQWISFLSPKVGRSLPKTIMLVVRSSGLWEASTQTCPKWDKKIYHGMLMPLHDSMPSFMNFRRVLDLLEIKNQASQCFAGNQRCPGVWNSFPFLAWDLSMHPRTHIWFFNQFICTGACARSSNLNYAHKCIENLVNA